MRKAYFYSTAILVSFFILSNVIIVYSATTESLLLAYGIPVSLGIFFSYIFHYVFTHENLFPFAKVLVNTQKKAEKKWLRVIPKVGKTATVFILGVLGGPILNAFAVSFLLPSYNGRYLLLILAGATSGIFVVAMAKGIFGAVVRPLLNF